MPFLQLLIGATLGLLVGAAAWRIGALTGSGAAAAAVVGGLIFGLGGWPWASALLLFFLSSSGLSRLFRRRKQVAADKYAKGSRRDWAQVAANGGIGTALVLAHFLLPGQPWTWAAFLGALAAVNADTWATELGVLSRQDPVSIRTGQRVEPGVSGGVTRLGLYASLAGALAIGGLALFFEGGLPLMLAAAAGGMAGSLLDSLLGATVQVVYFCPLEWKETEQHPRHSCGEETGYLRGWPWLNNDLVNLAASLSGAFIAAALFTLLETIPLF